MSGPLYDAPVWLIALVFLLIGIGFVLACAFAARRVVAPAARERNADLISFSVTNVAVFYGVLLAFLAVATWENYSKASDGVSMEAGLIANFYSDTEGIAGPPGAAFRGQIASYLREIIQVEWPMQARGETPAVRMVTLTRLHRSVASMAPASNGETVLMGDMLQILNRLDSVRAARIQALGGRVPTLIWTLIVLMGFLTVGLACFLPTEHLTLQAGMVGSLVLAIVLVLVMIVELDNPFRGGIGISAQPYQQAFAQIGQSPEPPRPN